MGSSSSSSSSRRASLCLLPLLLFLISSYCPATASASLKASIPTLMPAPASAAKKPSSPTLPAPASTAKKSYIVYVGSHEHGHSQYPEETSAARTQRVADAHYKFLGSFLGSKEKARDAIFYSYSNFINGFAANLDEADAAAIAKSPEVLAVFPNEAKKLHTTRSWEFLGLEKAGQVPSDSPWIKARFGKDTIIGSLDTGVWPERQSFNDAGLGPVPSRWKGTCESGSQKYAIRCNRKLIGARYFTKGYEAYIGGKIDAFLYGPRDDNGHGTHTLSTAAGQFVPRASLFGYCNGTAKGGSPGARVAAYKVCWQTDYGASCFDADILAAFDAAISDGVDLLSLSLGGYPSSYLYDSLAIGSFHAVSKGITVVCSAGNDGPWPGSVANVAPWIITVAASTMDRELPSYAVLGNGKRLKGVGISQSNLPDGRLYPLISSSAAPSSGFTDNDAQVCLLGSLDPKRVKGKIVVCFREWNQNVEKGQAVLQAGGVGMILVDSAYSQNGTIFAEPHVLPTIHLSYEDGLKVFAYIDYETSPRAGITPTKTILGYKPAPLMAMFSSQGPNQITPEILKPDITAPGVSVLAAFTDAVGPSNLAFDKRRVPFNLMSGTSMSCPHVAGIAGLLKTLHPKWSPAAIRSAIMTSATTVDNTGKAIGNSSSVPVTPFNYGSGHLLPKRAMDPGLVYDITTNDYLDFLCTLYPPSLITNFSVVPYTCPPNPPSVLDLNYPSITVPYLSAQTVTVARRLKNVGPPGTYRVTVLPPPGVSVTVSPEKLHFGKVGVAKGFRVTLEKTKAPDGSYVYGSLTWSDGVHDVRSPIVVLPGVEPS